MRNLVDAPAKHPSRLIMLHGSLNRLEETAAASDCLHRALDLKNGGSVAVGKDGRLGQDGGEQRPFKARSSNALAIYHAHFGLKTKAGVGHGWFALGAMPPPRELEATAQGPHILVRAFIR